MSPQTSNLRFALTAAGCACAGFGVVWASLAVRGMLRGAEAPARIERPDLAAEPDPASSPIAAAAPLADEAPERRFARFPIEQTSFDTPPGADAPPAPQRYGSPGRFGQALPPVEPELTDTSTPAMESGGDERTGSRAPGLVTAVSGSDPTEAAPPDQDFAGRAAPLPQESPLEDDPGLDAGEPDPATDREPQSPPDDTSRFQSPESVAGVTAVDEPRLPEDLGDIAAPTADSRPLAPSSLPAGLGNPLRRSASSPPVSSTEAPPTHPFAAAPLPDVAPPPTPFPPPASLSSTGITAGRTAGFADRADEDFDDGAPIPAHAQPARAAAAPLGAGMPFAAAPPIGPPPSTASGGGALRGGPAQRGVSMPPDQPPLTPTGQGRPGAIQLEGVQTPQLALEKRGPREIQVGKTARFEILVRNVGSATANDVVLRDSVPFGTALVATTPPPSRALSLALSLALSSSLPRGSYLSSSRA